MANSRTQLISNLKEQARGWVVLGIAVIIFYPVIFFNWDYLKQHDLIIPLGLTGIVGTSVWWFWTMRIVFTLLEIRREEIVSFDEILKELRTIRKELKKSSKDITLQ